MIFKYDLSLDNLFCLDIEAADEDEAQEIFEEMCENGDVQRKFLEAMADDACSFNVEDVWSEDYDRNYYSSH